MADSTPLEAADSDVDSTVPQPNDVEMTTNDSAADGENPVPHPQPTTKAAPTSLPAAESSASFPQLDGTNDAPPSLHNTTSPAPYLPNGNNFYGPSHLSPQQPYFNSQQPQPSHCHQPSTYPTTHTQPATNPAPPPSRPSQPSHTPASATQPQQAQNIGARPDIPLSAIIPPANSHGSPTRVYINSKVTPTLLEGMKRLALKEPEKPLLWLGEWLVKRSAEVEGG